MTSKIVCSYCGKEIDEGAYYETEQDSDDPAIVYNFHPHCHELAELDRLAYERQKEERKHYR